MLTLDAVWKSLPDLRGSPILQDCSYTFEAGRIYAILGTSGAGKTTLLKILNNLVDVDRGRILLDGKDINTLHPARVRQRISMQFQTPAFTGTTVEENLAFARRYSQRDHVDFQGLLQRVHLDPACLHRPVASLSVGQQQRVCLARTLVTQPDVLLLDEPTAALDEDTAERIMELVREVSAAEELLTIFVTHSKAQAQRLGDVMLELRGGKLQGIA